MLARGSLTPLPYISSAGVFYHTTIVLFANALVRNVLHFATTKHETWLPNGECIYRDTAIVLTLIECVRQTREDGQNAAHLYAWWWHHERKKERQTDRLSAVQQAVDLHPPSSNFRLTDCNKTKSTWLYLSYGRRASCSLWLWRTASIQSCTPAAFYVSVCNVSVIYEGIRSAFRNFHNHPVFHNHLLKKKKKLL